MPALLCTPLSHEREPEQLIWQFIPEQLTGPSHESAPPHVIVFVLPAAVTPPPQEPLPVHITEQTPPPHWMSPVHALSPQRIVHPVDIRQSMAKLQPEAGHSIEQAIPSGHLIALGQGLQAVPHMNRQTPAEHVPPPAIQASQAVVATGMPHVAPPRPP